MGIRFVEYINLEGKCNRKVQIWDNLGAVVLKKNNYFKEMRFNWGESVIFADWNSRSTKWIR